MDNRAKNIDNYFKDKLGNLEVETSENLWRRLYLLLIYKKLVLWGVFVLLVITGIFFLFQGTDSIKANRTVKSGNKLPASSLTVQSSETETTSSESNVKNYNHDTSIAMQDKEAISENTENKREETVELPGNNTGSGNTNPKEQGKTVESNLSGFKIGYITTLNVSAFKTGDNLPLNIIKKPFTGNDYSAGDGEPNPKRKKVLWSADFTLNPAYIATRQSCEYVYPDNSYHFEYNSRNIFILGASAGISASINHLFLKSGFEYSSYGQDAAYVFTTDEVDNGQSYYNYDTTWGWVYDPPEIYPYPLSIDSTFVTVYKTENINAKNRFDYLEIPFLIGYKSDGDKKVSFEISTGCTFGFLISASGKIPSPVDKSLLDMDKTSSFIRNRSVNYIARIGVRLRLSDRTGFIISPFYKRSLRSVYENSFPVKQNFNTFGISFGFDIKL